MPVVILNTKDRLTQWFTFLEEESTRQDGLLCFYDVPKSREVLYICEILAACFEELIINTD